MAGTNDCTFDYLNNLEWTNVVGRFNGVMASWYETIQQSDEVRLDQTREGTGGTWLERFQTLLFIMPIISAKLLQSVKCRVLGVKTIYYNKIVIMKCAALLSFTLLCVIFVNKLLFL